MSPVSAAVAWRGRWLRSSVVLDALWLRESGAQAEDLMPEGAVGVVFAVAVADPERAALATCAVAVGYVGIVRVGPRRRLISVCGRRSGAYCEDRAGGRNNCGREESFHPSQKAMPSPQHATA